MDPVTDQTPLLPFRRSEWVRAPLAHLRDYSCFSVVLSLHEPHTYREACTNVTPQTRQGLVHEKTTIQRPVNFFPKHFITVCQLRISKVQVH